MENKVAEPNIIVRKIFQPRVIFLILTILLILEGAVLVRDYLKTSVPPRIVKHQQITGGSFELLGPPGVSLGQQLKVQALLSTGGHTVQAVDLVLKYDPNFLEASPSAILNGKIFKDYPLGSVDDKNGIIRVSGLTKEKEGFVGGGIFATINFKAQKLGKTQVLVDFQKGETRTSNILDDSQSQNILEKVQNLTVAIQ